MKEVIEESTECTYADRHGVVLIDNGNNSQMKEFFEGIDRVQVSSTLLRQLNLCTRKSTWENLRTSDISPRVSRTCAMGWPNCPKRLSQSAINLP